MDSETDANRDDRETTDDACACRGAAGEQDGDDDATTDRWIADPPVLDAELPSDLRAALGQFFGRESIETLGDWVAECRRRTGGGSIDRGDLCHAGGETSHWGDLDGDRYYFECFYDAVALSALADAPVDVRTESPDGTVIEARAVGSDELDVTPSRAVFSFGIDEDAAAATEDPTLEDVYAAVCPYVRAFPDREAYERWAETVPAATVALPLAGATDVAAALVE